MSEKQDGTKKPTCPQCGEELVFKIIKHGQPGWGVETTQIKEVCPNGCGQN